MRYRIHNRLAVVLCLLGSLQISVVMAQISPLDYGLREAENGVDRYWALYNAHTDALVRQMEVSYQGIDTLELELPPDFKSIPLGPRTDFGGLVLQVTNNAVDRALFSMYTAPAKVMVDKATVDGGDFRSVPELAEGDKLLILKDQRPWTYRIGHGHNVFRYDLIWIHNGIGQNKPIAPWNTDSTILNATFVSVNTAPKVFRGLTLHRTANSSFKTYCLYMSGQYDVLVEDVHVTTPKSRMIADGVFSMSHCASITFRDVKVDGTYSGYGRWRDYGYAFSLTNMWNTTFERVEADGNWGVFGTNNMSQTALVDCDLNRFDIHCYGRDALLKRCLLRQRQTQFSSMYGTVVFDSCRFVDCIPVRIRSSYNAYTPFDIEMVDCTFEVTSRYHSLVNVMLLGTERNGRPELSAKCWPNLKVTNMHVVAPSGVSTLNLYHPTGTMSELDIPVEYLSRVSVKGISFVRPNGKPANVNVRLSSHKFQTSKSLSYEIE